MGQDSFKDLSAYDIISTKKGGRPSFTLSQTLDKTFPNGFPNFNNFRNNPQGFYDNFCYDAGYASERSPEEEEELPAMFDIVTLPSSRGDTESRDGEEEEEDEEVEVDREVEEETSPILQMLIEGVQLTTQVVIDVYPFINEGKHGNKIY